VPHSLRIAVMATFMAGVHAASAAPLYTVTHSVPLGAPDKWDYVYLDSVAQRVYVAHGTEISVVDAASLKPAGTLTGIQGAHGVLIVGDHGYASNGKSGTVTIFDPATLTPQKSLHAAPDADGMVYDPVSKSIYVVDGDSGSLTVIDTQTDAVRATVAAGGSLEFAGVDGRGHLFVNEANPGHVLRVDTATNKVTDRWAIPGCTEPTGLAVDSANHRVFTSCHSATMLVLNSDTGRVVATLPIGRGTDAAAFDPRRQRVYSSNADGTLSVFNEKTPDSFVKLGDVPTAPGARTLALDLSTGRIFVVTADVAQSGPPKHPGGAPVLSFRTGSVKLIAIDPAS
jgi:YVTN family beta-propeller protein